jgi:hypothetical protein
MKYSRFCTDCQSPYTTQPYGIFIAVWHLVRDRKVTEDDAAIYWQTRTWFENNLPIPPYYEHGNPQRAVTWSKELALETHIVKKPGIRQDIATKYGPFIQLISSELPGEIIYEDDYQVATISH